MWMFGRGMDDEDGGEVGEFISGLWRSKETLRPSLAKAVQAALHASAVANGAVSAAFAAVSESLTLIVANQSESW